nr:hypothetical protein [Tanacetum cinerariifolium]
MTETKAKSITYEYVTKARDDYYSGITKTMINRKTAYELKGKFLDDLQNNASSRTNGEDTVEHIENFLKTIDLLVLLNPPSRIGRITESNAKWDTTNVILENWLASKYTNHTTMDVFTKNTFWDYWKKGNDEIVLANGKVFNLNEEYPYEDGEIAEIFRIETNIFDYEMPMYKAFNEFNYLIQIDPNVLTKYIIGFKNYEEYKDDYIYGWNEDVPWNQGDVNDAIGSKKKTVVVTSDPLALIAVKTNVSRSKEKVAVSSDSEGSEADDFNELKKITALLAKAFNQRKFYSKPTNNNLRTSSSYQSANMKQEFVKTDTKKVKKKDDEKKRDMSRVKCYNCKKEGHFAKDCKKAKVKDYEYYKTRCCLQRKIKMNKFFWLKIKHGWNQAVIRTKR